MDSEKKNTCSFKTFSTWDLVDIVFKSDNNFTIVENFAIIGGSHTANKPEINLKKNYYQWLFIEYHHQFQISCTTVSTSYVLVCISLKLVRTSSYLEATG